MQKTVICPICNTKFETSKRNKKYCSFTCKEAAARIRRMKWEESNPGYSREYMRKYRQKTS